MSKVPRFLTVSGVAAVLAGAASLGAQNPVPPVKVGLWQTQMSQLDASGKEVPSPEVAAFARMAPEVRAQMAEMMRARGMQMPDEHGVMKTCLTRETLNSPVWQQMGAETGCTTTYSARSSSAWKWHSTCPSIKSESDGETTFTGSEAYRTKVTSTVTVNGKATTSTRFVQAKWLGAACGDVKPFAPPAVPGRGR